MTELGPKRRRRGVLGRTGFVSNRRRAGRSGGNEHSVTEILA